MESADVYQALQSIAEAQGDKRDAIPWDVHALVCHEKSELAWFYHDAVTIGIQVLKVLLRTEVGLFSEPKIIGPLMETCISVGFVSLIYYWWLSGHEFFDCVLRKKTARQSR